MLKINRNYRIEADSLNVTLCQREISKNTRGEERWRRVAYFSTCESALKALVDMEIRGTGLEDLKQVATKIQELKTTIDNLKPPPLRKPETEKKPVLV